MQLIRHKESHILNDIVYTRFEDFGTFLYIFYECCKVCMHYEYYG